MAEDTLLRFPDFTLPFDLHTDASQLQIGGVISHLGKPIGFFSQKFNAAQTNYTITEKEILSIVETLKHFHYTLYGHRIKIYTDHKNITYVGTDYISERVLRQHLILDQFGAEVINIPGKRNTVADALSRLPTSTTQIDDLEDYFSMIDTIVDTHASPIDYTILYNEQRACTQLHTMLTNTTLKQLYSTKQFGHYEL